MKYEFEYVYLDMTKYGFEYNHERQSWLLTWQNMSLNMFIKGKLDFRHDQIWLWVCLSKEKLTLDMSKYDFEYVC
jgi:hypothetical protein